MFSTEERPQAVLGNYSSDWPPPQFYANQGAVTPAQYSELKELIERGVSERELETFFTNNPPALALVLIIFQSGYHASWSIPKQVIRAHLSNVSPGLIPDYLIAGANSDGVTWWC